MIKYIHYFLTQQINGHIRLSNRNVLNFGLNLNLFRYQLMQESLLQFVVDNKIKYYGRKPTEQSDNADPNQPNSGGNSNKSSDDQMINHIKEAFRNCATNGLLTKNKFNQALAVLQTIGFKRLRDTPLADRLFISFDKAKNGSISEEQFSNGIKQVICDKHSAAQFTFRAYDMDGDNRISKKQFTQMIEQSWKAAFRLLSQQIEPTMNISTKDIQQWTISKISTLNDQTGQLFNRLDSTKKGFIEFQTFKEFTINSGYNDIVATIDDKSVMIPLNLTNLHM